MRVLLVSPVFHGYWHAFEAALASLGHDVHTHCYDAGHPVRNALAHRFNGSSLADHTRRRATMAAIGTLTDHRPDAVLVVKGDQLEAEWWDAVAHSGARSALWLYDELARMRYDDATLRQPDHVMSYSPHDVETLRVRGIDADVLPDGFDSLTPFTPRPSDSVSFIGARYAERERLVRRLIDAGERVDVYGREWSRHPWDIVRTRQWSASAGNAHRDIDRATYFGTMAGNLATLNIHGDGHDGFSMRTFEAPGVGALSLIDRPDVAQHYDVGTETLVFASDDELLEHAHRARRDPAWSQAIRRAGRRRTLAEHTLVHRMQRVVDSWA